MKPWAKEFYNSQPWQDTRAAYVASQNGLCERCKRAGKIVHHRKWLRQCDMQNQSRTLSWDNLELLCQDCHNREHMTTHTLRCEFDADGNPIPPSAGPPSKSARPYAPG